MDQKYESHPDFVPEPGKAYLRWEGADAWQEVGIVYAAPSKPSGAFEVRVNIPRVEVIHRSGDVEVDISDEFDLENGINLSAVFDTAEAAEDFARRWRKEESE